MEKLPNELLILIGLELDPRSLGSYLSINSRFDRIGKCSYFWRLKLEQDFSIFDLDRGPPFEVPNFDRMDRSEIDRYRARLLKFRTRLGISPDAEVDSESIEDLYRSTEEDLRFDIYPKPYLIIPSEPRERYRRFTFIRWANRIDSYEIRDYFLDPLYIEITRQITDLQNRLSDLKSQYLQRGREYRDQLDRIQVDLFRSSFNPSYYEILVTEDFRLPITSPFQRIEQRIKEATGIDLQLHNGLLIGFRIETETRPKYLISVLEGRDRYIIGISNKPSQLPTSLRRWLEDNQISSDQAKELFNLPFKLKNF